MLSSYNKHQHNLLFYGFSIILSCFIAISVMYLQGFHISIPTDYHQDALATDVLVKTFIEHGLSFKNPDLGAPTGYDFSDYPVPEGATLLILKMLTLGSHNFAVVLNLFFLLTFPLTTLISLFVLQRLGLNKPFALAASILFTFLPYHFLRMQVGHIFLNAYYVIPIYLFLIFSVLREYPFFGPASTETNKSRTRHYVTFAGFALACLFAASSGVYYAFYGASFLLLAGTIASVEKKQWFPLANSGIFALLICLTLSLNMLPNVLSKMEHGANHEVAVRTPPESEFYGLKITQLVLPVDQHRLKFFAKVKNHYNDSAPLVNENRFATLGMIGSLGFLLLLCLLFFRKLPWITETLSDLSRLNIAALLFATVGGISSLFAYFVTPMLRCSNRISVFIAFFSLTAFFLFAQQLIKNKFPSVTNKSLWVIALFTMLLGIYDQIPHMALSEGRAQFESDARFVQRIEATMPTSSMIMQLPYIDFPESPSVAEMGSYSLFRGYLHSHTLRWSFGAMRGRGTAEWQATVAKKPIKAMLDDLVYAGFTGLYVFRKGYTDHGVAIEKELNHLLHTGPTLVNDERDLAFYDLRPYVQQLHSSMSEHRWKLQTGKIISALNELNKPHLHRAV